MDISLLSFFSRLLPMTMIMVSTNKSFVLFRNSDTAVLHMYTTRNRCVCSCLSLIEQEKNPIFVAYKTAYT